MLPQLWGAGYQLSRIGLPADRLGPTDFDCKITAKTSLLLLKNQRHLIACFLGKSRTLLG